MSSNETVIEEECGTFCQVKDFVDTYATVIIWPARVLYVLVEIMLIKHIKELGSSFFYIAISCGMADILYFIFCRLLFGYMIAWFLTDNEAVMGSVALATAANMSNWVFYYAQVLGNLVTALNRYTALVMPVKHDMIWQDKQLKLAILLQWLLPSLVTVPMFLPRFRSEFDWGGRPWLSDPEINYIYWLGSVVAECFIFAPLLIFLYGHSTLAAYKHRKLTEARDNNRRAVSRTDLKLSLIGGLLSFLYVMICVASAMSFFEVTGSFAEWYNWYVWLIVPDIFTGINPVFLLLFSVKVRKLFMKMYHCPSGGGAVAPGATTKNDVSVRR